MFMPILPSKSSEGKAEIAYLKTLSEEGGFAELRSEKGAPNATESGGRTEDKSSSSSGERMSSKAGGRGCSSSSYIFPRRRGWVGRYLQIERE